MPRETRAFVSGVFVGAWIVVTAALLHDARSAPDCPDDSFPVRTTGEWVCVTRAVEVARLLGDTEKVVLATYSHVMPRDEARARAVMASIARGVAP